MAVKVCPNCSAQNPEADAKFCKNCGVDLELGARRVALQRQVADLQTRASASGSGSPPPPQGTPTVVTGIDPAVHQKALAEARRLTAEVNRLESEVKQAHSTQVTGKGATAKLLQQAQVDLSQWRVKAEGFERELKRVQDDLRKARADLAKTADPAALSQALNELAAVQSQLQVVSRNLDARNSEIQQLRMDLRDLAGRPTQANYSAISMDRDRLSRQLAMEGQRADRAEADARAKDRDNLTLESRLITEGQRYDTLESQMMVERVSVNSLRNRVGELEADLARRDRDVARYEAEITRRDTMEKKFLLYGAGAAGGLIVFTIMAVLGLGGVALPLIFLAGQLIVFVRAPGWAFNPRLTLAGWSTIAVPSLIIMLGMSFDTSVPWGMGLTFYFAQPFLVAIRAQHNP